MFYKYKCTKCGYEEEKDIPMDEYSKVRNSQTCSKCNAHSERVIEWTGMAKGYGQGWFGKSNGDKII